MTDKSDKTQTEDDAHFHVSMPQANRAAHAGQGVGQRELDALRDAGEPVDGADLTHDPDEDSDPPNV